MIQLPSPPPRTALLSFGIAISLMSGLLLGMAAWLLGLRLWLGGGLASALLAVAVSSLYVDLVRAPYRWWNKLARRFADAATVYLAGVCYFIIFAAAGRARSNLCLERPRRGQSLWACRESLDPAAYAQQDNSAGKLSARNWMADYCCWSYRSGNLWAICLLPFLVLLGTLSSDREGQLPPDIYTLY